jgi:hypothetical protein
MPGKYIPLKNYLGGLPTSQREVTLSFEQIERILNEKLPPSALKHRAWWANQKKREAHIESQAWMDAGWKVDTVNFTSKWVRFRRAV